MYSTPTPEQAELNRLRTALSHSIDYLYIFDCDGRFTYANATLLRLWKKSLDEVVGKRFIELGHTEEMANRLHAQIRQVIETKQNLKDESAYQAPDGTWGYYEYIFVPVLAEDGSVEAVAGSTRNITERKEAEAALLRNEGRFRAAFSHAPVGMVLTEPDGLIIEANQTYLDMLGYTRDEIVQRNSHHYTHPDDIAVTEEYGATLRSGDDRTRAVEKRYITKSGRLLWARASGTMRRADDGTPIEFIATLEDITQRKLAEQALRESEEHLQQIFAQAPVATLVLRGPDLIVELANPLFTGLIGGRQIVGQSLRQVMSGVGQHVWDAFDTVLATGEPFVANEWALPYDLDHDGVTEENWFNVVYNPLRDYDGTVSGIVAVLTDVSPQVRARQQLERANRELEEFAYVASHDLQEPLRMVHIFMQLLARELEPSLTATARDYISRVQAGATRMDSLLKDLLSFSRVFHGDSDSEVLKEDADLGAALSAAIGNLESRIVETGAVITTAPLQYVRGDEAHLALVFQNLIGNAIKYRHPVRPPRISITTMQAGADYVVKVADNGIGFGQEHVLRVFGLFKRLHRSDQYPGTGLGLAICKRIIERYGGRIWAESIPGEGSTFSFALPGTTEP